MTQPNFQTMTRKELLAFVLEHRDDQTAFYALMDKLKTEPVLATLPPLTSIEQLEQEDFPKLLEEIQKKRQQQS